MTNVKREKSLTEYIHIRVSEFEKNRLQWLSNKYADGNLSLYLIYHAMNAPRKKIDPENLKEYSNRHKKRDA